MAVKRNKYGSRKVVRNGMTFDSVKEYKRYCELALLERAGQIANLKLQVPFELLPAQYETFERYGKKGQPLKEGRRCIEKAVVYRADFVYTENGKTIVEDTKGFKTPEYKIKKKMLLYFHGIKIRET